MIAKAIKSIIERLVKLLQHNFDWNHHRIHLLCYREFCYQQILTKVEDFHLHFQTAREKTMIVEYKINKY